MQKRIKKMLKQFMALSLRERALVTASILVGVFVGWFQLVSGPMLDKSKQVSTEIRNLQAGMASLKQQHAKLIQARNDDPNADLKQRIAGFEKQIEKLDESLNSKLHGLITPKQMTKVLESVLQKYKNLKLVRVQSIAAEPLIAPATSEEGQDKDKKVELYRHGMQIEFEGSYLATLDYLKALETLKWDFYWDEVQLEVKEYPVSRIVITVHTLSLGKGWIGV